MQSFNLICLTFDNYFMLSLRFVEFEVISHQFRINDSIVFQNYASNLYRLLSFIHEAHSNIKNLQNLSV